MFPWRRALPKPDLKELLLAPEARTEALTPPREKHRPPEITGFRVGPCFFRHQRDRIFPVIYLKAAAVVVKGIV